jgi:signal recognition particle receptor subunit beta
MAVFNYAKKEIDAKIVYYGPAISGKTTNLQFIHQHLKPDQRGKMVSLATSEDRTLFFDFLPIELESVRGFRTRFHLYTVPGQVYYGATRRAVLTGADGVVFVADSSTDRMGDNLASFKDLEDNLRYYGKKIEAIPLVIQYNKRDLSNVVSIEELNQKINRLNSPHFESVAIQGKGVFEALTMACRLVLKAIENGVGARRSAAATEKVPPPPPAAKELRMEKASAPPETGPLRIDETAGKNLGSEKEKKPVKPPPLVLERPPSKVLPKEAAPPETVTPVGKIATPVGEKLEQEKKLASPAVLGRTLEKKKQEFPLRLENEKGISKKPSPAKEHLRILSCSQPRVKSPSSLEIPLTLEVEAAEKSVPLHINLSINVEQIDPKVD